MLGGAKTGLYGQAPRGSTVSSFVTGFPLAAGPGLEALDSFDSSALKGSFGSQLWIGSELSLDREMHVMLVV